MHYIILSGGCGSRLYPLSTKEYPKQFLKMFNGKSLFQLSIDRVKDLIPMNHVYTVTNSSYIDTIKNQCPGIPLSNIIVEPSRKNTAAAIAFASGYINKICDNKKESICVVPSDHMIDNIDKFKSILHAADIISSRNNRICTFGIKTSRPETGFGYIKCHNTLSIQFQDKHFYFVDKFTEKPNQSLAEEYFIDKSYLWNSGMFVFSIDTISKLLKQFAPDWYSIFENPISYLYDGVPSLSIDYALMEKCPQNIIVHPCDIGWDDVGSFDSLIKYL